MPNKKTGFTLIELLVVISIIAILSVIGLASYSSTQASARDARRKGDLEALTKALEQYKTVSGAYPHPSGCLYVLSSNDTCWTLTSFFGADSNYMQAIPKDPSDHTYYYCTDEKGSFFILAVNLETGDLQTGPPGCDTRGSRIYSISNQL